MTLADIDLPVDAGWAKSHALVFDQVFANRIAEVHSEYGDPRHVPSPVRLSDGRLALCADILTECAGGFLTVTFSHLDRSRFSEVGVIPWADAVALLPPEPPDA